MTNMVSQITCPRLFSQMFVLAKIKETSTLTLLALCEGNRPVTDGIPPQKSQWRWKCFHGMASSCSIIIKYLNQTRGGAHYTSSNQQIFLILMPRPVFSQLRKCASIYELSLQWGHNERDGVSNHRWPENSPGQCQQCDKCCHLMTSSCAYVLFMQNQITHYISAFVL